MGQSTLEYCSISLRRLAKEIGISILPSTNAKGKQSFSLELTMMMDTALGVDVATQLSMQNEYDMLMAERDELLMEKPKHIRCIAAIF